MNNTSIEPELNSLLSKLTVEIENDSKEIEVRKKRIEKNEALLRAVRNSLSVRNPEAKGSEYGAKAEVIRAAIGKLLTPEFIQDDVEYELRRSNPSLEINRSRVRSALWTMADKGEIKVIRRGTNKEPALYQKSEGSSRTQRTMEEHRGQTLRNAPPMRSGPLTAQEIEHEIRRKNGRINDVADRLGTTPSQVLSMLEPASRVYMAGRGWLKLRE